MCIRISETVVSRNGRARYDPLYCFVVRPNFEVLCTTLGSSDFAFLVPAVVVVAKQSPLPHCFVQ